jgi:DNA/RNA endonuclease YhcR with UshA esterase domain
MRIFKWLILALAIAGVGALLVAVRSTTRPLFTVASITPAMNFAYVRIAGVIPAYPSLSSAGDYLSFTVQDDTGQMRVSAYRSTVNGLLAQSRIPMPGDQVSVEGSLRVRDDDASLTLEAPEALTIQPTEAISIDLAGLDALPLGARASLTAQVREVRDLTSALRRVTLRSGDAQAQMLLPVGLADPFGDLPTLQVGDWVHVAGGVGEYRGEREVLPARASDVETGARPVIDVRPMNALTKGMAGRWVAVQGGVDKLQPVTGGMLLGLKDAQQSAITVVMFDAWSDVPFSQTLRVGDTVVAQGKLVLYKSQLEVQPELGVDLMRDQ